MRNLRCARCFSRCLQWSPCASSKANLSPRPDQAMRIRRIIQNDFRAFPGPKDYEFELDGKNLLLFGENGSGKSSIFVALREFFNRATTPRPFQEFRNVFTTDPAGQPLTTGKVSVEFEDGTGLHTWDIGANVRPVAAPPVADASLRFGAVDYR